MLMLLMMMMMLMLMLMMVYSEEDIVSQYRALINVSRGSAIVRSVFSCCYTQRC